MEILIHPTTQATSSTAAFGIPHLIYSPDPALNDSSTQQWPGYQRAPRMISVLLICDRNEELPASAELYIEFRVHHATETQPEVWQTVAKLTPKDPEWRRSFPVDPGLVRARKPESSEPYGAALIGYFGQQQQQSY